MIAGNIHHLTVMGISDVLLHAFDMLKNTNFYEQAVGTYPVDGDNLLYHVQEYETSNRNDMQAEIHQVYCDIQFVVSGKEAIGWAPYDDSEDILLPYDTANDIQMLHPPKNETMILMEEGSFVFFAPHEIHRPRLNFAPSQKDRVKKVVVKVRSDTL